tara:strand:+ start:87773 stop:88666 length:894 start_codon:yes stop_codon:yes gene_type:complete
VLIAITYLTCAIVWGTTWFAIRVCIGEGGFPTLTSAALRFTIAAILLRLLVMVLGSSPGIRTWHQRSWFTIAGLLNGAGYALVYLGEETVPGAFASILFGTLPLLTAFLAAISKTERVTLGHFLGALIALGGIVVIFGDRASVSSDQSSGVALLCGGVVLSAFYSLVLKRESSSVHALCATSWFLSVTAAALWLAALVAEGWAAPWPPPFAPTMALLYLAIFGSVLTFASYLYLLQRVSLMTTTTLVFIQPVIALFVDSQWEDDVQLTLTSYVGAAITLGGVLVAMLWKRYSNPKAV